MTGQATVHGITLSADALTRCWIERAFEWSNLYLAIPLGFVGFAIAICQIIQAKRAADRAEIKAGEAKTAADAAKAAAEGVRYQFKTMSVTVLLTQLQHLEESIERAIHDRALILLLHLLQDWRWQASACREYLNESIPAEADAMTHIQKSVTASTNLKPKILEFGDGTDWAKETRWTRKTMADVTANLGALTAQQTMKES